MASMEVRWGSEIVHVPFVNDAMSVLELKELLSVTGVASERMKLIRGGRLLDDTDQVLSSDSVTLVGSREELPILQSDPLLRNDLASTSMPPVQRKYAVSAAALIASERSSVHPQYRFHAIETLDLPDRARAKQILEELANDPGVLAVLAKHAWSVGALAELYPEGEVGVSEVCVLGLNQNNGARISLRIRTDDLKGFRKILSIRKVLCHELAHNEHSDHGDAFYMLMRVLEREVEELDWRRGRGGQVGGPMARPHVEVVVAGQRRSGEEGRLLGGAAGQSVLLARPMEPQLCLPCTREEGGAVDVGEMEGGAVDVGEAVAAFPSKHTSPAEPAVSSTSETPVDVAAVLRVLDEGAANVFQLGDESLLQRMALLRSGLLPLVHGLSASELRDSLSVLLTLLGNAKDLSDPKYRSVSTRSKTFMRAVARRGGIPYLLAAGFSESDGALTLARRDDALLYMGVALLQAVAEVVSS